MTLSAIICRDAIMSTLRHYCSLLFHDAAMPTPFCRALMLTFITIAYRLFSLRLMIRLLRYVICR